MMQRHMGATVTEKAGEDVLMAYKGRRYLIDVKGGAQASGIVPNYVKKPLRAAQSSGMVRR